MDLVLDRKTKQNENEKNENKKYKAEKQIIRGIKRKCEISK